MSPGACPDKPELVELVLGTIPSDRLVPVTEHIDSCRPCQEELKSLEGVEETLLSVLGRGEETTTLDTGAALDRALKRIEQFGLSLAATGGDTSANLGTIRDYRLLSRLGQGGMGTVYRALHTRLDKIVAVKLLSVDRTIPQAVVRFNREMKAVGKLHHENIVQAFDAGEHNGTHFLAMELVEGADLSAVVHRHGPLPIADACELVRQTAVALEYVRQHGMVHRDIKPSNLVLSAAGQVKMLDLGLALLHDPAHEGEELTSASQTMGTADYLAPEQAGDSHNVDIRADIYSLGCTLYKLLTGNAPYVGAGYGTVLQKMMAHIGQPFPDIGASRSDVPPALKAVLDRMVAKEPSGRFATPAEVAAAIGPFCQGHNLLALASRTLNEELQERSAPTLSTNNAFSSALEGTVDSDVGVPPALFDAATQPYAPVGVSPSGGEKDRLKPGLQPPNLPRNLLIAAAAVGGLALLLLGVVLYWQTREGTVRIEINDERITAKFDQNGLVLTGADKKPITITAGNKKGDKSVPPGDHTLTITRDDFTFKTKTFQLDKKGKNVLRIDLLAGDVRVSLNDKEIDRRSVGVPPSGGSAEDRPARVRVADPERVVAQWALERGVGLTLQLGERTVSIPVRQDKSQAAAALPSEPFRISAVHFTGLDVRPEDLDRLKELRHLSQLLVDWTSVGDAEMAQVASIDRIERLVLYRTKITDACFDSLVQMPNLNEVIFGESAITSKGWRRLPELPKLHTLNLVNATFSDEDALILNKLPNLDFLVLGGSAITDKALDAISTHPALDHVKLGGPRFTDGVVEHLAKLPALTRVTAERVPLTDACVETFASMKRLKRLDLTDTKISSEGVARLRAALPNCRIELIEPSRFTNSLNMQFALVPKGKSWLGGGGGQAGTTEVEFKEDFYLGVYEVTQDEWEKVMGDNPSHFKAVAGVTKEDLQRFPVETVSWDDAQRFLEKLNQLAKEPGWTYRLPTENEWEYACRGGPLADKSEAAFHFYLEKPADELGPEQANFEHGQGLKRTCRVGMYPPNRLGLHDMHGNVWEWCQDAERTADGDCRINRGGSWWWDAVHCRAAYRSPNPPTTRWERLGLRLARVRDSGTQD